MSIWDSAYGGTTPPQPNSPNVPSPQAGTSFWDSPYQPEDVPQTTPLPRAPIPSGLDAFKEKFYTPFMRHQGVPLPTAPQVSTRDRQSEEAGGLDAPQGILPAPPPRSLTPISDMAQRITDVIPGIDSGSANLMGVLGAVGQETWRGLTGAWGETTGTEGGAVPFDVATQGLPMLGAGVYGLKALAPQTKAALATPLRDIPIAGLGVRGLEALGGAFNADYEVIGEPAATATAFLRETLPKEARAVLRSPLMAQNPLLDVVSKLMGETNPALFAAAGTTPQEAETLTRGFFTFQNTPEENRRFEEIVHRGAPSEAEANPVPHLVLSALMSPSTWLDVFGLFPKLSKIQAARRTWAAAGDITQAGTAVQQLAPLENLLFKAFQPASVKGEAVLSKEALQMVQTADNSPWIRAWRAFKKTPTAQVIDDTQRVVGNLTPFLTDEARPVADSFKFLNVIKASTKTGKLTPELKAMMQAAGVPNSQDFHRILQSIGDYDPAPVAKQLERGQNILASLEQQTRAGAYNVDVAEVIGKQVDKLGGEYKDLVDHVIDGWKTGKLDLTAAQAGLERVTKLRLLADLTEQLGGNLAKLANIPPPNAVTNVVNGFRKLEGLAYVATNPGNLVQNVANDIFTLTRHGASLQTDKQLDALIARWGYGYDDNVAETVLKQMGKAKEVQGAYGALLPDWTKKIPLYSWAQNKFQDSQAWGRKLANLTGRERHLTNNFKPKLSPRLASHFGKEAPRIERALANARNEPEARAILLGEVKNWGHYSDEVADELKNVFSGVAGRDVPITPDLLHDALPLHTQENLDTLLRETGKGVDEGADAAESFAKARAGVYPDYDIVAERKRLGIGPYDDAPPPDVTPPEAPAAPLQPKPPEPPPSAPPVAAAPVAPEVMPPTPAVSQAPAFTVDTVRQRAAQLKAPKLKPDLMREWNALFHEGEAENIQRATQKAVNNMSPAVYLEKAQDWITRGRAKGQTWMDTMAEMFEDRAHYILEQVKQGNPKFSTPEYADRLANGDALTKLLRGGENGFDWTKFDQPFEGRGYESFGQYRKRTTDAAIERDFLRPAGDTGIGAAGGGPGRGAAVSPTVSKGGGVADVAPKFNIGDELLVTQKGERGASVGKNLENQRVVISGKDTREDGGTIYRVAFQDKKGKTVTRWFDPERDDWKVITGKKGTSTAFEPAPIAEVAPAPVAKDTFEIRLKGKKEFQPAYHDAKGFTHTTKNGEDVIVGEKSVAEVRKSAPRVTTEIPTGQVRRPPRPEPLWVKQARAEAKQLQQTIDEWTAQLNADPTNRTLIEGIEQKRVQLADAQKQAWQSRVTTEIPAGQVFDEQALLDEMQHNLDRFDQAVEEMRRIGPESVTDGALNKEALDSLEQVIVDRIGTAIRREGGQWKKTTPPNLTNEINRYLKADYMPELNKQKVAANAAGRFFQDQTVLNYEGAWNIETALLLERPFIHWWLHSALNYTRDFADHPAMLAFLVRFKEQMDAQSEGMPDRYKHKMSFPIGIPGLGDSLWITPSRMIFPWEDVLQVNAIDRAGFQSVKGDGSVDPSNIVNDIFGIHMPIKLAINAMQQDGEEFQHSLATLPAVRLFRGLTSFVTPGGVTLGLENKYDKFYIERAMKELVAEGALTDEQAQVALLQQVGEDWQSIQSRAGMENYGARELSGMFGLRGYAFTPGEQKYLDAQKQREQVLQDAVRNLGGNPNMTSEQRYEFLSERDFYSSPEWQEFKKQFPELDTSTFINLGNKYTEKTVVTPAPPEKDPYASFKQGVFDTFGISPAAQAVVNRAVMDKNVPSGSSYGGSVDSGLIVPFNLPLAPLLGGVLPSTISLGAENDYGIALHEFAHLWYSAGNVDTLAFERDFQDAVNNPDPQYQEVTYFIQKLLLLKDPSPNPLNYNYDPKQNANEHYAYLAAAVNGNLNALPPVLRKYYSGLFTGNSTIPFGNTRAEGGFQGANPPQPQAGEHLEDEMPNVEVERAMTFLSEGKATHPDESDAQAEYDVMLAALQGSMVDPQTLQLAAAGVPDAQTTNLVELAKAIAKSHLDAHSRALREPNTIYDPYPNEPNKNASAVVGFGQVIATLGAQPPPDTLATEEDISSSTTTEIISTRLPEDEAQTARARSYYVDKIWEVYRTAPELKQKLIAADLGEQFTTLFLNTDTRDIDSIPIKNILGWANALDVLLAKPIAGADMPPPAAAQVTFTTDDQNARYQTLYNEVDDAYGAAAPGAGWQSYGAAWDKYWALKEQSKDAARAYMDSPEGKKLTAVRDRINEFFKDNPDLEKILMQAGLRKPAAESTTTTNPQGAAFSQALTAVGYSGYDEYKAEDTAYKALVKGSQDRRDYLLTHPRLFRMYQIGGAIYKRNAELQDSQGGSGTPRLPFYLRPSYQPRVSQPRQGSHAWSVGPKHVSTRTLYQMFAAMRRRYPARQPQQGGGTIAYRDGSTA